MMYPFLLMIPVQEIVVESSGKSEEDRDVHGVIVGPWKRGEQDDGKKMKGTWVASLLDDWQGWALQLAMFNYPEEMMKVMMDKVVMFIVAWMGMMYNKVDLCSLHADPAPNLASDNFSQMMVILSDPMIRVAK